jgi:hypothetical protein
LRCYRYIELNPVRAAMVAAPEDYRWSSHAANAFGAHDPLLQPHPAYLGPGRGAADRQQVYRTLVAEALTTKTWNSSGYGCSISTPSALIGSARTSKRS